MLNRFLKKLAAVAIVEGSSPLTANQCHQYSAVLRNQDFLAIDLGKQDKSYPIILESFVDEQSVQAIYRSFSDCVNNRNPRSTLTVVVPPGADKEFFAVKHRLAGSLRIGVSAAGLQGHDFASPISGGAPDRIEVAGRTNPTTGVCVAQQIQLLDASSNLASKTSALNVSIRKTNSGAGKIFSNDSCSSVLVENNGQSRSVTLPGTNNTHTVYFRSNSKGTTTFTFSASGLQSRNISYSVGAGPPTQLAVTDEPDAAPNFSADDLKSGPCHEFTVEAQDDQGNPTNQVGGLTVSFIAPSGAKGVFYRTLADCNQFASNNNGSSGSDSFTIPSNRTDHTFVIRGIQVDTSRDYRVEAVNKSGIQMSATISKSFRSGDPRTFVVSGGPSPAEITAGNCTGTAYTIALRDRWGQSTIAPRGLDINVSGESGQDAAHAGTSCSGSPISTSNPLQIGDMGSTATFSFTSTKSTPDPPSTVKRKITVSATGTPKNDLNQNITLNSNNSTELRVKPRAPSKFTLTYSADLLAGVGNTVTLRTFDQYGNPSDVTSDKTFSATPTTSGGEQFVFASSGCSGSASPIQVLENQRQTTFCVKKNTVSGAPDTQALSTTISATGFTALAPSSPTLNLTLEPNVPTKIEFDPKNSNVTATAGDCLSRKVRLRDAHNNLTRNHSERTITFAPNSSAVHFYDSASSCSGTNKVSMKIAANNHERTFRYQPRVVPGGGPGTGTTTVSVTLVGPGTSDSYDLTFGPDTLSTLSLTASAGATNLSLEGDCGDFTISATDTYGNKAPFGVTSLNATPVPAGGVELYPTSCGSGGSTTSLAVPDNVSQKAFKLRGKKVRTVGLTLNDGSVTSNNVNISVSRLDFAYSTDGIEIQNVGGGSRVDRANSVVGIGGENFATAGFTDRSTTRNDFTVSLYKKSGANFNVTRVHNDMSAANAGPSNQNDQALAIAKYDATTLVAVGYADTDASSGVQEDMAVMMVRISDGAILASTTFDYEGSGTENDRAHGVAVDGSAIYVVGKSGSNIAVAKLSFSGGTISLDGTLDPSLVVAGELNGATILSGNLIAAGRMGSSFYTMSINSALTTALTASKSFDGNSDFATSVTVSGGSIYVAGVVNFSRSDQQVGLIKYTSSLAESASRKYSGGGSREAAYSVVVQGNGKIVLAGSYGTGSSADFALFRFNTNFAPDNTFGPNTGMVTTAVSNQEDIVRGVAIINNRLMAVGQANTADDHAFARYRTE